MNNSFQTNAIRKLNSAGIDAEPRGNWLTVNGEAVYSTARVDAIYECGMASAAGEIGRQPFNAA